MKQEPSNQSEPYKASREIMRGVGWAVVMRWVMRSIGLVSTIILARLLSPEDFGIAAMAGLVIGFLFAITELGTSMLLIRTKVLDQAHCDTAWTITLIKGLIIAILVVLIAPYAAVYFKDPRVIEVMYVLALGCVIGGFCSVGPTLIRRELKFDLDFRYNIYKKLLIFVATVGLAIYLRNYWALVIGHLVGTVGGVILSYLIHPYRPRWSLARAREYIVFSLSIVPMRIGNQIHEMAPKFMAGSLGPAAMGTYSVSTGLATLFTKEIVTPMGRGLFPNYTRLADDKEKLSVIYRKILGIVVLAAFPIGIGVAATAEDLVMVLLGSQWGEAVPVIKYLAVGGALYAMVHTMYNQLLVATGRERAAAVLSWVRLLIAVPVFLAGLSYNGLVGLAQATIVAPLIYLPLVFMETRRAVHLPLSALLGLLWRPLLGVMAMYLMIHAFHADGISWSFFRLIWDIAVGAITYLGIVYGLWFVSGRSEGAESVLLKQVGKRLKLRSARNGQV